jgi:hypothetical protein
MSNVKFVVGYNMPGYMPDAEPGEFDNAQDALLHLRDLLKERLDELSDDGALDDLGFDEDDLDSLRNCIAANPDENDELAFTVCGWAYWISRETRRA